MATEVRFALALNGGVSLAVWIGGLSDELLRLTNAGRGQAGASPEWVALCQELDVMPIVDVIAGTSAGGLNGAFLAAAIVNGARDLNATRDLWIEAGAFSDLLRAPIDADLPSLLRGDDFFLPRLEEAITAIAKSGDGVRDLDPPIDVCLTATAMHGRHLSVADGSAVIDSVDHRVELHFRTEDFDLSSHPDAVKRLGRAMRSTASFPGAFEPSPIEPGLYDERHAPAVASSIGTDPSYVVDGGVLVNLPAINAVDAIIRQPSHDRVERVLALIVPDPGIAPDGTVGAPSFLDAVSKSSVGIPRNQSLTEFVTEVREHNGEVRGRRAARAALLAEMANLAPAEAWSRQRAIAVGLFPSYQAARHRMSLDRMETRQAAHLDAATVGVDEPGIRGDLNVLPWVPRALEPGGADWTWGGTPVRRLASLLVTWINAGAATAHATNDPTREHDLYAQKQAISDLRRSVDRCAPVGAIDELLRDELAKPDATPAGAVRAATVRWAAEGDRVTELTKALVDLAAAFHAVVELLRPLQAAIVDPDQASTIAGVIALHDGAGIDQLAHLLLSFEVVEVAFAGTEPRPDQTIRLAEFTAHQTVTIDPSGRAVPAQKLAGVQLGHFAAFLKRSWRANDWMWGRLDGAERMVRLLDQVTDGALTKSGRLDHHLRAVEAAVLRDILPVVAQRVSEDGAAGANVPADATAFVHALDLVRGDRPVGSPLVDADEATLASLLEANKIGAERLAGEAGSKLSSQLAITAIATTFELARRQGPKSIQLPVRLLASGSMTAWRLGNMARRRRVLVGMAIGLLTLLSGAVVVADLAGNDIGLWVVPAAMVFAITLAAMVLFAVPVLRVLGGRMGRGQGSTMDKMEPKTAAAAKESKP